VRRLVERAIALVALVAAAPALIVGAAMVRRASRGPVFYRARRVGRGGREFAMFKLRTMRCGAASAGRISGGDDPRVVSRFGEWLRRTKIDELPQLLNVVRGEMAIIGPRPEDPEIVRRCYAGEYLDILQVLPGLAGPGRLYASTHGEQLLPAVDAERHYIERVLPIRLTLDLFYVRHRSLAYDLRIAARTVGVIVSKAFGRRSFACPPELSDARASLEPPREDMS
jgi:lipopolysaccharide/colanic/teichoic acid biosynthesis glycosyltransferase